MNKAPSIKLQSLPKPIRSVKEMDLLSEVIRLTGKSISVTDIVTVV